MPTSSRPGGTRTPRCWPPRSGAWESPTRSDAGHDGQRSRATEGEVTRSLTTDRLAGSTLAAFAIFALWESYKLPFGTVRDPGPGTVPFLLAIILLLCSLMVVAGGAGTASVASLGWSEWRHAVAILGACVFMALALERLGYRLTIVVVLFGLLGALERKRWFVAAGFAIGFAWGTYFLFNTLLRVPMPQGPFGF